MKFCKQLFSFLLSVCLVIAMFAPYAAFAKGQNKSNDIDAPQVFSYCNITSKPVIYWLRVTGAEGYNVYRSNKPKGKFAKLKSVKYNNYTDTKAKAGKNYYYKVVAYKKGNKNKVVNSSYSNTVKQYTYKTVLVGDSILNGVKEYKVLPKSIFVTKIGVGPNTFNNYAYKEFAIKGAPATGTKKLISVKPDRAFIMLGNNEIDWSDNSTVIDNYQKLIDNLKSALPKCKIIILSVAPTTKNVEKGNPTIDKINAYNKELNKFCKKNDLTYYDYNFTMENSGGYLLANFDDGDGCHWNMVGCNTFASQIDKFLKYC